MSISREMRRLRIADPSDPSAEYLDHVVRGKNRAVFVDRDGVINQDMIDLGEMDRVSLVDNVGEALDRIKEMGYLIVIVTNQGGIGYGLLTLGDFISVMGRISDRIGGIPWDRVYFSPYHEKARIERYRGDHPDRKPNPGMILRAVADLDIDPGSSWMIGDHLKDIEAGNRAGCKTILVSTGRGKKEIKSLMNEDVEDMKRPDILAQDLNYASRAIEEDQDERCHT